MSLREQFEAWFEKGVTAWYPREYLFCRLDQYPDEYLHYHVQKSWQAYQAGHAVNAELLKAMYEIELEFYDSPAQGALASKMASIATEAIKKARGE